MAMGRSIDGGAGDRFISSSETIVDFFDCLGLGFFLSVAAFGFVLGLGLGLLERFSLSEKSSSSIETFALPLPFERVGVTVFEFEMRELGLGRKAEYWVLRWDGAIG